MAATINKKLPSANENCLREKGNININNQNPITHYKRTALTATKNMQ